VGGKGKTTMTSATSTSTHTSASSSSGSSVFKKTHLTLGELIGIAVGGVVLLAAIVAGI
jgi:hypothetical protein